MHDLDRTLRTYDSETSDEFEFEDQEYETSSGLSEEDELALAEELLTLSGEAELDEFFRKLLKKAATFAKPLAKTLLPIAGTAVGGFFGGPIGAKLGGKLGSLATNLFEVDETLPPSEQELEMAKQFVRFATTAAANAGAAPANANPRVVVQRAVTQAARTHASGAIGRPSQLQPRKSGRWIRRGNRIVIYGAC